MPGRYTQSERAMWLRWIIAATTGSILGGAGTGALVGAAERLPEGRPSGTAIITLILMEALAYSLRGAAVGTAQWLVLRRAIDRAGWWVAATLGGWVLGGIVRGVLFSTASVAVIGAGTFLAFMLLPAIAQWLVLRQHVARAGWWVLGQAVIVFVSAIITLPLMLVAADAMGWSLPSAQGSSFQGAIHGPIEGIIGGALLVWLLRRPLREAAGASSASSPA